jgi:DNA-binding transcriptional LysR family regulator
MFTRDAEPAAKGGQLASAESWPRNTSTGCSAKARLIPAKVSSSSGSSVSNRGFTIAAPIYFCVLVIPHLISRIRAEAPGITIHVVPVQESLVVALDRGAIDVTLGAAAVDVPARLVQDALYREDMVWISRRDNPVAKKPFDAAQLVSQPRVGMAIPRPFHTMGEDTGDTLQLLPRRQLEFEARISLADITTVYDSPTAIAIAARTDFVTLAPKGMALHAMKHEEIAILGDAHGLSLEMAMLWHSQHRGDAAPSGREMKSCSPQPRRPKPHDRADRLSGLVRQNLHDRPNGGKGA